MTASPSITHPINWEDHKPFAIRKANQLMAKSAHRQLDRQCVICEHFYILYKCASLFDQTRGINFTTYAGAAMRREAKDIVSRCSGSIGENDKWNIHNTQPYADISDDYRDLGCVMSTAISDEERRLASDLINTLNHDDRELVKATVLGNESVRAYSRRVYRSNTFARSRLNCVLRMLREMSQQTTTKTEPDRPRRRATP